MNSADQEINKNRMLTEEEVIRQAIRRLVNRESYIRGIDTLDEATKLFVTKSLTEFVAAAVPKYIAGQIEHGGKITDRNCKFEMKQEIIDLYFYLKGLP